MMKPTTYLDYAASAPMRPEVSRAMTQSERWVFGNPSSIHGAGRAALNQIDEARTEIGQILNCRADELVFTSGGTEADNLAILGTVRKFERGHIVTSMIEHKAVLESCKALEAEGYDVTYVRPTKGGVITAESVREALRDNTVLVSIMYVNNETGIIQPIAEIGKVIAMANDSRDKKIAFHTDAVQAANLLSLNVAELGVDMLGLSAHKVGGPKGVGCLYVKTGFDLAPQIFGGGQQRGVRSGTLNTAGIVGLATALTVAAKKRETTYKKMTELQNWLENKLKQVPSITFNGDIHHRSPSILNFSVKGMSSDSLVIGCDLAGVAVSAASACASGSIQPSYVLEAMEAGEAATSSLRVSMGYATTRKDLIRLVSALTKLISV